MKRLMLLLLLFVSASAHSFFLESDFADAQFSIKGRALDYVLASQNGFEGSTYIVQVEVLRVYYGDLDVGDTFELVLMSEDMLQSLFRDNTLEANFATNFCLSESGVYFTDKLYRPRKKTFAALTRYGREGTSYWDRHDCQELRGTRIRSTT